MYDYCGGESLLTNFKDDDEDLYRQAIELSHRARHGLDLYVVETAYDAHGIVVEGHKALHTNNPGKDHGPFWRIYDSLKS